MKMVVASILTFSVTILNAQTQPFPANVTFTNGLMATNRADADATASYNTWKTNFVEACSNGRFRVKFDNALQTVSEGVAYGMLLTVYKADKVTFDGLWNYYKDNRNGNGVMNWKINGCSGTVGQNGATDAELDAAMALIVADYQWGSTGTINYRADALALIAAMKQHEVEANTFVLKPGDMFGGSALTNPSYFAPAYYRAYGVFSNDVTFWNNVATKAYDVINANLTTNNAVGGLVSDWCQASGAYSNQAGSYVNNGQRYTYDAARTPWRIATDYVWYGNTSGKTYAKKCSDFVRVTLGGTANIKDGYYQNGNLSGQWHNATFVGAFACAAMAGENQTHLNDSYTDLKNLNEPNSYFNHTLKTMYQFLLTGNFYLPSNAVLSNDGFSTNELLVELYPNPTSGLFTLSAPVASQVSVLDVHGKVVLEKNTTNLSSSIDMSTQASGIYFVKIKNENKLAFRKIVIN
ncbi:MAG: T9SS type A sorting domain-containing protein [Flavobacterium sp.]|nr:T9SS type A sorting domain-containing protein [Flavobacterium sp.]